MQSKATSSSESLEHLLIKEFLFLNLPSENEIEEISLEKRVSDQIIDVYVKLKNKKEIAVEIQHSKISKQNLIERTRKYNSKGLYVLWILNGGGVYGRSPRIVDGVPITSSEKELHRLYGGRVYYLNATSNGITSALYSLHFADYYDKKYYKGQVKYYKRSKTKKSLVYAEIPSKRLKLFRNSRLKLCQFEDHNLKYKCVYDILNFCKLVRSFNNSEQTVKLFKSRQEIPIGLIIEKFQRTYGKYLIFDCLRHLKLLGAKEIKYVLERELWIEKEINLNFNLDEV